MESKQTIKLHCLESRTASGYVTFGSYWEKGTLVIPNFKNDGMDSFVLQNENKESIPVQSRITAWWPDGSIKWVAHTADASKMGQEAALTAQIKSGEVSEETAELVSMITRSDDNWLYIDNGVLSLKVPTGKYKVDTLAEDIFLNGKLNVKKASPVLYLEEQSNENSTNFDLDGQTKVTRAYKAAIKAVTIEEDGPLALTIKAEGSYQYQNQNKMKFYIRMYIGVDLLQVQGRTVDNGLAVNGNAAAQGAHDAHLDGLTGSSGTSRRTGSSRAGRRTAAGGQDTGSSHDTGSSQKVTTRDPLFHNRSPPVWKHLQNAESRALSLKAALLSVVSL